MHSYWIYLKFTRIESSGRYDRRFDDDWFWCTASNISCGVDKFIKRDKMVRRQPQNFFGFDHEWTWRIGRTAPPTWSTTLAHTPGAVRSPSLAAFVHKSVRPVWRWKVRNPWTGLSSCFPQNCQKTEVLQIVGHCSPETETLLQEESPCPDQTATVLGDGVAWSLDEVGLASALGSTWKKRRRQTRKRAIHPEMRMRHLRTFQVQRDHGSRRFGVVLRLDHDYLARKGRNPEVFWGWRRTWLISGGRQPEEGGI